MKRITFYLIVLTLIISCNKEDLQWNLVKVGRLPTISTGIISNITNISAFATADVTYDGGTSITARGVCWNTSATPLVSGSHTSDSVGLGSLTSYLAGLTAGTIYYVRAYATNSIGTAYGNQVTFSTTNVTVGLATLTSISATSITQTAASSGGNISNDGGNAITAKGVCWSTSSTPIVSGSHTTDGTGTVSFTSNITGLTANTFYYVRAYATNSIGTAYGNQVTFSTTNVSISLATLTTDPATSITQTAASSGGNISNDGGSAITERGVCWSTSAAPIVSGSYIGDGTGTVSFTSNITGLTANTTYYVRAYATNSVGTAYGNQVSFTTLLCNAPTVVISSATYAYAYTNQLGDYYTTNLCGEVTNQGGGPITNSVIWFNQTNPPGGGFGGDYTGVNIPFCEDPVTLEGIYYLQIEVWNSCGISALSSIQQMVLP